MVNENESSKGGLGLYRSTYRSKSTSKLIGFIGYSLNCDENFLILVAPIEDILAIRKISKLGDRLIDYCEYHVTDSNEDSAVNVGGEGVSSNNLALVNSLIKSSLETVLLSDALFDERIRVIFSLFNKKTIRLFAANDKNRNGEVAKQVVSFYTFLGIASAYLTSIGEALVSGMHRVVANSLDEINKIPGIDGMLVDAHDCSFIENALTRLVGSEELHTSEPVKFSIEEPVENIVLKTKNTSSVGSIGGDSDIVAAVMGDDDEELASRVIKKDMSITKRIISRSGYELSDSEKVFIFMMPVDDIANLARLGNLGRVFSGNYIKLASEFSSPGRIIDIGDRINSVDYLRNKNDFLEDELKKVMSGGLSFNVKVSQLLSRFDKNVLLDFAVYDCTSDQNKARQVVRFFALVEIAEAYLDVIMNQVKVLSNEYVAKIYDDSCMQEGVGALLGSGNAKLDSLRSVAHLVSVPYCAFGHFIEECEGK